jgi:hypothetical protein
VESLVFRLTSLRRSPDASRETLSLTATAPNEQPVKVAEAVVHRARQDEFSVEERGTTRKGNVCTLRRLSGMALGAWLVSAESTHPT